MAEAVFDASAILALLNNEQGAERALQFLGGACISAVNVAEVAGRLEASGLTSDESRDAFMALGVEVMHFDSSLAWIAAGLYQPTRALGLSLGDRACLATATQLSLPTVTADRQWSKLKLGIKVISIR